MAEYTVKHRETGQSVTFDWQGANPPTREDIVMEFSKDIQGKLKSGSGGKWMEQMPESGYGGIPKWGLQNPKGWGARGAGLELYDKAVQPTVEAVGMVGGSFGSPVVGTALGYGAGKKVGEMGRGFLERAGMPEDLQRRQRGVAEEIGKSVVDVAEPLVMGAAFNKVAKIIQPIDAKITAAVKKGIEKGIRPTVVGKKLFGQNQQYYERAEDAVRSIVENKKNLNLTTPFGEVSKKQVPQNLAQFQEAIHQTKAEIFKQYDALSKLAGDKSATVSGEGVVKALREFLGDDAIKTISPSNYGYAKKLMERFTLNRTGITDKGMATGVSETAFKRFTPETAQNMIKTLNASLKAFYKNPTYNTAKRAYVDSLVANNLRRSMDETVLNATGGHYQALKNKYGSLKAIEDEVGHRLAVDLRKSPKGLIDFSDVFTGYHAAKGILTLDPATIGAAGIGKTVAWLYRIKNQPNHIVKQMFNDVDKLMTKQGVAGSLPYSAPKIDPVVKPPYRQRIPVNRNQKTVYVNDVMDSGVGVKKRVVIK